MTKEDKQIIDRATKENWRIFDRTRLKRLLEKNLELYRENEELENKIADIKANCDLAIEGRDVRIMELEQEHSELLDVINNQDVKIVDLEQKLEKTEKDLTDYQFNYPSIKELEKENAELKEKLNFSTQYYQGKKAKDQLTKAKEVIKSSVVLLTKPRTALDTKTYLIKAEQFLKEIEK